MTPRRLTPEVLLSVTLDAICSRNRYTKHPNAVLEELQEVAGDRVDILAEAVGTWVGFFEDQDTHTLCKALRELPGLEEWIAVGAYRRSLPDHRTPGVLRSSSAYSGLMLFALIRPVEISTADVIGTTLEDVVSQLDAVRQPGFDLVSAPVRMLKGEAKMEATGTFRRADGVREISADSMAALESLVPEGWQMLSVRRTDG